MPRPRYIICCEDRVVDKETGRISHFNVIDKLVVRRRDDRTEAESTPAFNAIKALVTATWMREDQDDPSTEYEYEMTFCKTDGERINVLSGTFKFVRRFFRTEFGIVFSGISDSGLVWCESRIRKKGSEGDWLVQAFPVEIEMLDDQPD